jgi:rRNA-processing protein FCF1
MVAFIEIILLIAILGFLVLQSKGGLGDLLGRKRKIILDSCALIDGRVVELARNGFLADDLVIPQFVLNELQLLADGNDGHKRERARFGLDIAHELQDASFESKVIIDRTPFPEVPTTDDKLIHLAKKLQAYLYTTDYNLSKVAAVEAVGVLNINELSQALRPIALPGETLAIKIVQKGSNHNQGVGYLDDGTMIVVEGAARLTGRVVDVTVTRMHQTVAGKMVFGQVRDRESVKPTNTTAQQAAQKLQQSSQAQPHQQDSHHPNATQNAHKQPQQPKLHQRLRVGAQKSQTPQAQLAPQQQRRPIRKPVL